MEITRRSFFKKAGLLAAFAAISPKKAVKALIPTPERVKHVIFSRGDDPSDKRVKALAVAMKKTKERVAADVYNNAFRRIPWK